MKNHFTAMRRLAIVAAAALPGYALALPASTTAYYTDTTNKYVQDQTSQVMNNLNGILCYMGAMAPSLMVGAGNYIALIDKNVCESSGSGGQSGNTGPAYTAAVVNASRASTADPMLVKAWVSPQVGSDIRVYATATEAPTTTNPYGVFRMDYCGNQGADTTCASDQGFINATASGLTFYSSGTQGTNSETTQLLLNATSSTVGSGAISQAYSWNGTPGTTSFKFSYNANYFVRNDTTGDICFDRNPANAAESVWRYGLYDSSTGAQITRNSGFPVEYTASGVTYNGYIGYYGLWMPVTVPSGSTVNQVTYSNSGATKTAYTLLSTGGKLTKYTTATKNLADLNKVTFWYFAQNTIPVTGGSITSMASGSQYELYWDNANSRFAVSGQQGATGNMQPLATPGYVANADMVTANPWGLFGWSQMMGGMFGIKGSDFALLTGGTPSAISVKVQTQDVVYPNQFAALGNLTCINDCPTAALITTSNASISGGSAFTSATAGWTPIPSSSFSTYTLDSTTGNLIDPAAGVVVSTATTGTNANGIRSGRLVTAADAASIISLKNTACGSCNSFNQGDVDLLPVGSSYYVWETGGNPWNQIAILMNGSTPVTFDPPIQVSFAVPNTAKYGSYAGATISLQYGGFGDLWGIPNECVDITTNTACDFTPSTGTAQSNMRWTPNFSIPFDTTTGVVTANAGATTYLVKPLDMEVRLAKVDCTTVAGGLSTSGVSNTGLPTVADWTNPYATVGAKPTVTAAPQVIHGVKQY